MFTADYVLLALTLLLFPLVSRLAVCYFGNLSKLFLESDLFELAVERHLQDLDEIFGNRNLLPIYITILYLLLWPFIKWHTIDPTDSIRNFVILIASIISWKAFSLETDLATGKRYFKAKIVLFFLLLGIYYYPGFIAPFLFASIFYLRAWFAFQTVLLRTLQMCLTYFTVVALAKLVLMSFPEVKFKITVIPLLLLNLCIVGSHYLLLGISKLGIGKNWFSWMNENRRRYLAIAAYMWGWKRYRPVEDIVKLNKNLAKHEYIRQYCIVIFELSWLFVLVNYKFAIILLCLSFIYHLKLFKTTGVFFWQSILLNASLLSFILQGPPTAVLATFSVTNGLIAAAIMLIFPLNHLLWDPVRGSGWDTPFIGRVHWQVQGRSGKIYGLYADFIPNHEHFFAGTYANFLIPRPIFHKFLGRVPSKELRKEIILSKGDPVQIQALQEKFGNEEKSHRKEQEHDAYLVTFFKNYNSKKYRQNWMKVFRAPSEQYFFSGPWPAFKAQEKVARIIVTYREEFFNGKEVVLVRDDTIKELVIPVKKFSLNT